MHVLEDCIAIFRENLFSISGRKQIPFQIYEVLERELILEETGLTEAETSLSSMESDQPNMLEQSRQGVSVQPRNKPAPTRMSVDQLLANRD